MASVALSMFLMLVFMTYNAWLIAAVLSGASCLELLRTLREMNHVLTGAVSPSLPLGAGAGFFLFNRDLGLGRLADDKGAACH